MAHFAELDDNNKVLRIVVINNEDIIDANGKESEELGIAFCHNLYGGRWIQTSYNSKIRVRYAQIGFEYREDLDAFILPKPFPSWTLNIETYHWDAPVPYPTDGIMYEWNEEVGDWEAITYSRAMFEVPD